METMQANQSAVVATFDTHQQAELGIKELQKSGFDMNKLSIIGRGYHSEEHPLGFYTSGDRIKTWGGIGAFWGGLWGILLGAAFFWVPGFGPLAVAGPIVGMLAGGLEGAAVVGGVSALVAALMSLGLPKRSAIKYETQLKADKYLVIAHGSAEEVDNAREILQRACAGDRTSGRLIGVCFGLTNSLSSVDSA